jgi:hypothetical protein
VIGYLPADDHAIGDTATIKQTIGCLVTALSYDFRKNVAGLSSSCRVGKIRLQLRPDFSIDPSGVPFQKLLEGVAATKI